jgi:tetratricopeptide (TPR) repeat protein
MRRSTRLFAVGAALVALASGGLYGGVLADLGPAGAAPAVPALDPDAVLSGFGRDHGTAATVARLESELRLDGRDPERLSELGLAYQVRWRETGNAAFLPLAGRALHDALGLRPKDATATLALGNLALIRHDFRGALGLGRRAQRLAPFAARPYGVVGDALVELGRYRAAFATFDRMASLKPSLASYARVAYARELRGDRAGAAGAMSLALDAAGGSPEPTAWAHVELAKLALGDGRVRAARLHARAALAIFPGYAPALEQLARGAGGPPPAAVATARRAVASVPLPQYVALLGDLLERRGRTAEAAHQRATVAAIDRLLAANGLRVDLESAVFRADHAIEPADTVRLARGARAARPSIYGDDALGWALARAGRCAEAERWLDRALRLGTKDALLYFHRGYAAGCAGDRVTMRGWYRKALDQSSVFSVRWGPVARRALR